LLSPFCSWLRKEQIQIELAEERCASQPDSKSPSLGLGGANHDFVTRNFPCGKGVLTYHKSRLNMHLLGEAKDGRGETENGRGHEGRDGASEACNMFDMHLAPFM